jgi:hypothetical protein
MSQTQGTPSHEHRTVVAEDAARQGTTGHNARYVLGISLAAAVVVLILIYAAYFGA